MSNTVNLGVSVSAERFPASVAMINQIVQSLATGASQCMSYLLKNVNDGASVNLLHLGTDQFFAVVADHAVFIQVTPTADPSQNNFTATIYILMSPGAGQQYTNVQIQCLTANTNVSVFFSG